MLLNDTEVSDWSRFQGGHVATLQPSADLQQQDITIRVCNPGIIAQSRDFGIEIVNPGINPGIERHVKEPMSTVQIT